MNKFRLLFILAALCCLFACKRTPKTATADPTTIDTPTDTGKSQADPDLMAVTNVIHEFYKWYDAFQKDDKKNINFLNSKGKYLKLDKTKVDAYFDHFAKSGFISKAYIDSEKAYLKKCEAIWQKEKYEDGPPAGLDADRVFCAQDWDINYWTTSPVTAEGLGTNNIKATMSGTEGSNSETSGGAPKDQKFELVKEYGKWLIAGIDCPSALEEISAIPEKPTVPYAITVTQNGEISLAGKKENLDNLQKDLYTILMKQAVVPKSVPVKYEGEVLMGMRGEVETEVSQALAAAKKAKTQKASNTAKGKVSSTTKKASPVSLVVNQKGGTITLDGKKVALEDLKKQLQNTLVKKAVVPDEIPIQYVGETGMGMRAEVRTEVESAIAGAKWVKKSQSPTTIAINTKSPIPVALVVTEKGVITLSGKKIPFDDVKKEVQTALLKLTVIPDDINIKSEGTVGMGMRGEVRTAVDEAISGAKWIRKKAALEALRVPVEKKLTIPVRFEVVDYKTSGNFAFATLTMKHKNGKAMDFKSTPYEKQYALGGSISDNVFGLLKFENGAWKILTYSLGPTDVPYINWQKDYNAPKELFD